MLLRVTTPMPAAPMSPITDLSLMRGFLGSAM